MRWRLSVVSLSCLTLLAAATLSPRASAQDGPDIFVTPVPNAPFGAVVDVGRSIVRRNGSVVNLKTFREIGRDTRGRIHNELRTQVPATSSETPELLRVHLYDPQNRVSVEINIPNHTFWTRTMNHPPSTVPPTMRYASPDGSGVPPNEFTRQEDLGTHEIDGVPAHGIREIQTIPADSNETGKDIEITDEYWYSEDLRINLMVKHSDPRTGTVTLTVSQVQRTEPDAAFFEIPEGYKTRGAGQ